MFLVATQFICTNIALPFASLVYITIVDKLNYMGFFIILQVSSIIYVSCRCMHIETLSDLCSSYVPEVPNFGQVVIEYSYI